MRGWPLEAVETEMRRLKVLRYLADATGYEAAASVLRLHCARIGVPTTPDQVTAAMAWLAEMELVTLRHYEAEPIAKLTTFGRDVAEGIRTLPGVLRPDP
ncbi:hypothetical protein T8T21_00780 [Limimaricola variabilis]|uniref:VpaChn25_0724 family phage protein n=1 Tax=Limimaricola variabilis TaxID=1492771 RepID=UPI002AC98640|nr:hypothetical protein [Limimaricola variabilis]WPY94693.1 hypothetical protein T8T21_00780 [Limimaricola variabilis]